MNPKPEFHECCRAFAASYDISTLPAMREIEQAVLGCDYGGTSWTTRAQASQIVDLLRLGPGISLLEIGAGSGWPGLYLASESGCAVMLLDLPVSALVIARQRARLDGDDERVSTVAASGDALPFRDGSFHAIDHSDVLCCLPAKEEMLAECRRVAADGARMLFSVIHAPPGLPAAAYRKAVEVGPPFVDAPAPYPELLEQAGWRLDSATDVTREYVDSLRALVRGFESSKAIVAELGADAVKESIRHRQTQIDSIERGYLVREVFLATAS